MKTQEERIKELERQVEDYKWRIIELERTLRSITKML